MQRPKLGLKRQWRFVGVDSVHEFRWVGIGSSSFRPHSTL